MQLRWWRPAVLTLAVLAVWPNLALAHIHQEVGLFDTEVGWLDHLAIEGQLARLDVRIATKQGDQPVTGAEKTLKAELMYGDQKKTLDLIPQRTTPGAYTTDPVLLTQPGDYKVHLTGTVNGEPLDATYDLGSDPDMIVQPASRVAFPPAASLPSTSKAAPAAASTAPAQAQGIPANAAPSWAVWAALALAVVALIVALLPRGRRSAA